MSQVQNWAGFYEHVIKKTHTSGKLLLHKNQHPISHFDSSTVNDGSLLYMTVWEILV